MIFSKSIYKVDTPSYAQRFARNCCISRLAQYSSHLVYVIVR